MRIRSRGDELIVGDKRTADGAWERLSRTLKRACAVPGACRKPRKVMPEYVAGRLDERERERVEEHVGRCPHCRNLLAKFHLGAFSPWDG